MISIIVPCYNEQDNVLKLYSKIKETLKDYEIIFIDDGSTDDTYAKLRSIKDKKVKIIKFTKNFGQSAAWDAGFSEAKGNIIITMDADLQNDPSDIPKLLKKLNEGYDAVSGWRYSRKDNFSKKLFSFISRLLRSIIINDNIHDSGCSLKAYKRYVVKDLRLNGEMHRYITEIISLKGYKVGEVKVNHYPRKHGRTKYNLLRIPKGFLDLLVIWFWQKYSTRPVHLFGGGGIIMSLFGALIGFYLLYMKFIFREPLANRPLLLLAVLMIVIGIQFLIFGLIADIAIKIYYSDKKYYTIEK